MNTPKTEVTVTRHDIRRVPAGALSPRSVLVIGGTASDGQTVYFRTSEKFVLSVITGGDQVVSLEPHEILKDGEE